MRPSTSSRDGLFLSSNMVCKTLALGGSKVFDIGINVPLTLLAKFDRLPCDGPSRYGEERVAIEVLLRLGVADHGDLDELYKGKNVRLQLICMCRQILSIPLPDGAA